MRPAARDEASGTFYWDSLRIANSNVIDDPEEAARELRDRVMDCVRAWASCYSGITLSVSGGLDSSIVYASLRDTPAKDKLTCFHCYPVGTDMDERRFARLVAGSGGSPLIERPRDPNVNLQPLLEIEASHEPIFYLAAVENSAGRMPSLLRSTMQRRALTVAAAISFFTRAMHGWGSATICTIGGLDYVFCG